MHIGFALWCLLTLASVLIIINEFNGSRDFDSSIMALLPKAGQTPLEVMAERNIVTSGDRKLLLLFSRNNTALDSDNGTSYFQHLEHSYQLLLDSAAFTAIDAKVDPQTLDRIQAFYLPYRYQLVTDKDLTALQDSDLQLAKNSAALIFSPLVSSLRTNLDQDPLQLFHNWQQSLLINNKAGMENRWLKYSHEGTDYFLMVLQLHPEIYDIDYQRQVLNTLDRVKQQLPSGISMLSSGLIIHAAYAANNAEKEISTIGVGSACAILVLLWLSFGQLGKVFLAFLPIVSGFTFSLAVNLLIFPQLHLITLVFGATLVGVAMDYSLHILCAGRHWRHIRVGLLLGLISSCIAYGAMTMTPFPGLRQMALFSVAGLTGAWLTALLALPYLQQTTSSRSPGMQQRMLDGLRILYRLWPRIQNPISYLVVLICLAVLLLLLSRAPVDDSLRSLQTSPPQLLQQDQQVQNIIGAINPGYYFILRATNTESLLQLEERFREDLTRAIQQGQLQHYHATSNYLPSLQRQQRSYQANFDLYNRNNQILAEWAALTGLAELATEATKQFSATANTPLMHQDWQQSPLIELTAHLWLGELPPGISRGGVASLIQLGGVNDVSSLAELAKTETAADNDILFVNRPAAIANILAQYREQMSLWLVFAYPLIALLLVMRYRRRCWRIVAVPAFASLLTVALLSALSIPLTLFHVLALLLVLGIGMDSAILLLDANRRNQQEYLHSWLAVSLASITTLLAFGLLSLSNTPVLQFFGQTVMIGIICVWLLAPVFTRLHPSPISTIGTENK